MQEWLPMRQESTTAFRLTEHSSSRTDRVMVHPSPIVHPSPRMTSGPTTQPEPSSTRLPSSTGGTSFAVLAATSSPIHIPDELSRPGLMAGQVPVSTSMLDLNNRETLPISWRKPSPMLHPKIGNRPLLTAGAKKSLEKSFA